MSTQTYNDMPETVFVNRKTHELVESGYPSSEEYVRKDLIQSYFNGDEMGRFHNDDISFISHA